MQAIEKVMEDDQGNVSVKLTGGMHRFLTAFFSTNPSKLERLVLAQLQVIGVWSPKDLAAEKGLTEKSLVEAFNALVEKDVLRVTVLTNSKGRPVDMLWKINWHLILNRLDFDSPMRRLPSETSLDDQKHVKTCRTRLTKGYAKLDPALACKKLVTSWRLWVPDDR